MCLGFLFMMFRNLFSGYRSNTASGSAAHLIEINRQEKVNIEAALQKDKSLVRDIADEVSNGNLQEEQLLSYLRSHRKNWNADELFIYTYDGQCLNQDEEMQTNDQASQFAAEVLKNGEAFRIVKSKTEYGISLNTDMKIGDSRIAVVSVIHNLDRLVDEMGFSSFGGEGSVYLTRQNGARISSSGSDGTKEVYNVTSLFGNGDMQSLGTSGLSLADAMKNGQEAAFLFGGPGIQPEYVILTPVSVIGNNWFIITIVPEKTVNRSMNDFSRYVLRLSLLTFFLVILIFVLYFILYRRDNERYNAKIRKREQELREALTLANSANVAKTQFLSGVSHDIRTPLNAIVNMAGFLSGDLSDTVKAKREISVIQDASKHLLRLINDVLDMSRIESGKITFSKDAFDMNETADNICEIIRPLYEAKRQNFRCTKQDILHPAVLGDVLRLNQILINLLNNAVKFTPEGGNVWFTVTELKTLRAGTVPFRFVVEDSGIGIPESKLKTIFDPFSRVENETVVRTEGTGLGLAITKSYVEAQGGKIAVRSVEGKGSVFTVELYYSLDMNVEQRTEKKPAEITEQRFDGKTALLAEDNEINREIAQTILSSYGFSVECAENGEQAAERYRKKEAPGYDVIYMDIQMPVMNGYDAAKAIRASEKEDAQSVPIIAMTANAFAEDVEHARSVGMNAHVAKPINPDELIRVTAELLKEKDNRRKTI